MKIAFIVPTKDRPDDLRRMLTSLNNQTRRPEQVIIVDASKVPLDDLAGSFSELSIDYLRWEGKPSAAAQRNGGLHLVRNEMDLVCFFDDDQVLHADALSVMLDFWVTVDESVGGASFYDTDHLKDRRASFLKRMGISVKLGLYSNEPGRVAASGWQSMYGVLKETTFVEWMGSGASVIRKDLLELFRFDEFFDGCSYLEDVDFSYSISRKFKLAVLPAAKFDHAHAKLGRSSAFEFGKAELRNRLYLVKKHKLSLFSFALAMMSRWLITMLGGFVPGKQKLWLRGIGNIAGLFS